MIEKRLYCFNCQIDVEYVPELGKYACGRCERLFDRHDVLTITQLFSKARNRARNYYLDRFIVEQKEEQQNDVEKRGR